MEVSSGLSPRFNQNKDETEENFLQSFDLEAKDDYIASFHFIHPMNALEILRETVRILRYNLSAFMAIAALLICPVSAVVLSNVLVDQSLVKRLSIRLLLVAKSSGFPLKPFIKQSFQKLMETAISGVMCFPLYITLSLLSKAAVFHSVHCTYLKTQFDRSKFYEIISKIWKRIVVTYLWVCGAIAGCLTLFFVLLIAVSSAFSALGFASDWILYPAVLLGLIFSIVFANAILICNIALVISVLEDVSGSQALLRSSSLVKGQTQVGLTIFLVSITGMVFVEGLFEHRVNTISYGDGSSRIWEGPLLVVMYSFVVLIDYMSSTVFYFSCISYSLEASNVESESAIEALVETSESTGTPQNHAST